MGNLDKALDRLDSRGFNHVQGLSTREEDALNRKNSNTRDAIEYALTANFKRIPDWMQDNAVEFMEGVFAIMGDAEDDKEGRIRDLRDKQISQYSDYIEASSDFRRRVDFKEIGVEVEA